MTNMNHVPSQSHRSSTSSVLSSKSSSSSSSSSLTPSIPSSTTSSSSALHSTVSQSHSSLLLVLQRRAPALVAAMLCFLAIVWGSSSMMTTTSSSKARMRRMGRTRVFLAHSNSLVAKKKIRDFQFNDAVQLVLMTGATSSSSTSSSTSSTATDNEANTAMTDGMLQLCGPNAVERFQKLMQADQAHLAVELWKYCVLSESGGLYVDVDSPLLVSVDELLDQAKNGRNNLAVLSNYFPQTIHGSILFLQNADVAQSMLSLLLETPIATLQSQPLLVPKTLYSIIDTNKSEWFLYHHSCLMDPMLQKGRKLSNYQPNGNRISHICPLQSGYCCQVQDPNSETVILMTKHPVLPYQILPTDLPRPFLHTTTPATATLAETQTQRTSLDADLPFISTITQVIHPKPKDAPLTPNFFDTLVQNNCLPADLPCSNCLRDKKGANCNTCKHVCPCYCKTLCKISVDEKHVAQEWTIHAPKFSRDPNRLIPRIIHQTWFEPVTSSEKYPNMSRLIQSWKQSGWEYKFYSDEESRTVLKTHFPPQVLEAYDSIIPGAFKADLFRYCILLIYGGVYSDMDVLLESNLDAAIAPDVGFMTPVDEPGSPVGKRMCLWNGLIAAAPGHPFLAKAIETVVNNIRNRFTSVDVDATFCPDPELSILHAFDTLFTAGPCILGSVVNKVVGRHGQTQFEPGVLDVTTTTSIGSGNGSDATKIPGRTIILKQNKWDMGAHRFTLLEKNLVVAATDMPDYDDRDKLGDAGKEHYSKTHVKSGIYGLDKLYKDHIKANEDVRLSVV